MDINKIKQLINDNRNKSKEISRSIHALDESHNKYCRYIIKTCIKDGMIDDMFAVGLTIGFLNLLVPLIFKSNGFIICLLADSLLLITIPVIDFIPHAIEAFKKIKINESSIKAEKEMAKKSLDKCYEYMNNLEGIINNNKINHEMVNQVCKTIEANPVSYNCKDVSETNKLENSGNNFTNTLKKVFKINQ